jgi:sialic acid synthase SpsE
MVEAVRTAEKALGSVQFASGAREANSRKFRRSLFVVEDIKKGELFTKQNVRSIRPADGLHPRHLNEILGKRAASAVERGTPLSWALVVR